MLRLGRALVAAAILACGWAAAAQDGLQLAYPKTRTDNVVEVLFGEKVADPYRWLESDLRSDPEVADWVGQQNALSRAYLAALPQRPWFEARIRALMDYERFGLPVKAGKRYFYTRNSGLLNQPQLFVRSGVDGTPRLLLDPNSWAEDGTIALDAWKPSPKGRQLLYSVAEAGSDWRTLRVVDVGRGKVLPDELHWLKFTGLAWVGEEGFLYSRFPEPGAADKFLARNYNQAIWFHRVGTPQSADVQVYATPNHPDYSHRADVTSDGRYAVISSRIGTADKVELHVIDLAARGKLGWQVRPLVSGLDNDWKLIDGLGGRLWFVTDQGARNYRLMVVDLNGAAPVWNEVIGESAQTLLQGRMVGNKLILSYLKDGASQALVFDLGGQPAQLISLRGIGTAAGFQGRPGDDETFYSYTSFNLPPAVYRYDLSSGRVTPFAVPKLGFDPDDYVTQQRIYTSKDGTRVPLLIVRRKDVAASGKPVPTLLYGYGGFDVSLNPTFSPVRMAWLEAGGAFALASLRGGGEFGKDWHEAGRLANKQNVFDDFIAAGEFLIKEGITPRGGLAIQGGSNGGLLIAAVVNQRPDLFAAANPSVGVMDMLRFNRFTAGRYWMDDYGDPSREADFRVLRAYSPYHNVRGGRSYPAILVTTGDTDDRVVPAHSFKYVAALQAADIGPRPHLLRVEPRAGHGAGKPTDKQLAEGADVLAFLAQWTGLKPS